MELKSLRDDQLIAVYRKLRANRDAAKKRFVEEQKPGLDLMENIEGEVGRRLAERGSTSVSCETGVAYTKIDTTVKTEDWPAFFSFMQKNNEWGLIEQRAAKTPVMEWVEEKKETPPGLSIVRETKVIINAPRRG